MPPISPFERQILHAFRIRKSINTLNHPKLALVPSNPDRGWDEAAGHTLTLHSARPYNPAHRFARQGSASREGSSSGGTRGRPRAERNYRTRSGAAAAVRVLVEQGSQYP